MRRQRARTGAGAGRPVASRRLGGALVAGGLSLVLSACGVATGGGPKAVPRTAIPNALVAPLPSAPPTTAPVTNDVPVDIYLLNSSQALSAVGREVSYPAALKSVLQVLVEGPTQGETLQGYWTAIPQGVSVLSASQSGDIATVNLSSEFGQISGTAQVQAVEQFVFTVTSLNTPDTGVQFEVDGQPTEVPIGTGEQSAGPVYEWAYVPTPSKSATTSGSP